MSQRDTTELERDAFQYLNELRETGAANMLGLSRHIQNDFGLDKQKSRILVKLWADVFDADGYYSTITTDVEPLNY